MSRGLSTRQREALAVLAAAGRSLDVTEELLPALGLEPTATARRSLIRAVRSLALRGLVVLERKPDPRGGHPRVLARSVAGVALAAAATLERGNR